MGACSSKNQVVSVASLRKTREAIESLTSDNADLLRQLEDTISQLEGLKRYHEEAGVVSRRQLKLSQRNCLFKPVAVRDVLVVSPSTQTGIDLRLNNNVTPSSPVFKKWHR